LQRQLWLTDIVAADITAAALTSHPGKVLIVLTIISIMPKKRTAKNTAQNIKQHTPMADGIMLKIIIAKNLSGTENL